MKLPSSSTFTKLAVLASLALGGLPMAAQASHSDDFTVWNGAGQVVEYLQVSEAQEIANGPAFVYRLHTRVDASQFGNYTTLYDDPLNPAVVSDIFGIAVDATGALALAFSSDVDGIPFPYLPQASGANNFFEGSAAAFDATMYLARDLRDAGWTAAFRSDNALNNIPEPGSLSLLAIAGIGLLGASRRRAKAA